MIDFNSIPFLITLTYSFYAAIFLITHISLVKIFSMPIHEIGINIWTIYRKCIKGANFCLGLMPISVVVQPAYYDMDDIREEQRLKNMFKINLIHVIFCLIVITVVYFMGGAVVIDKFINLYLDLLFFKSSTTTILIELKILFNNNASIILMTLVFLAFYDSLLKMIKGIDYNSTIMLILTLIVGLVLQIPIIRLIYELGALFAFKLWFFTFMMTTVVYFILVSFANSFLNKEEDQE